MDNFWSRVLKTDTCWLWQGVTSNGYGRFPVKRDGKPRYLLAHRVAYEELVGPIPEGLQLDHLCRVHSCVNPDHLEAVTGSENCLRGLLGRLRVWKTHCPHGHPYDEVNTYVGPSGRRDCRACNRISQLKHSQIHGHWRTRTKGVQP